MLLLLLQSQAAGETPPPVVDAVIASTADPGSGGWGGYNEPQIQLPTNLYDEAEEIEMATIAALVVRMFR